MVTITVGCHKRIVNLEVKGNVIQGNVGGAVVYWGMKNQMERWPLPFVKIPKIKKGKRFVEVSEWDRIRATVALFVKEYFDTLQKGNRPVMHFEHTGTPKKDDSYAAYKRSKNYISGIPYWMWLNHKEWHLCADGKYWRKTAFLKDEESLKMIERYYKTGYCGRCIHRIECQAACGNPEVKSAETVKF